jgi:hypothetical protein
MRGFGVGVAAVAIATLLAAVAVTPSDAARRSAPGSSRAFDGLWSVSIMTQSGPCNPTYRYPARIVGGIVQQAENDFSYQISGIVVASGGISVTVTQGLQSATGYGRLYGSRGSGHWSAAGGQCRGTWSAIRRG